MATVNYTIYSNAGEGNIILEGSAWSGSIYGVTSSQSIKTSVPTSVDGTAGSETVSFNVAASNGVKFYPSATDENYYLTFRSQNIATQYPTTGFSLDIWSKQLYDYIDGLGNWDNLVTEGPFNLNNFKYTLLYNYAGPNASFWCKGGKISFTITP